MEVNLNGVEPVILKLATQLFCFSFEGRTTIVRGKNVLSEFKNGEWVNYTKKDRFVLGNFKSPFFWGAFAEMLWGKFSTQCVLRLNHATLIDINGNL